jgi:hypothetical protein
MEVEPNATVDEEEHFDHSLLSCIIASERAKQCHSHLFFFGTKRAILPHFIKKLEEN